MKNTDNKHVNFLPLFFGILFIALAFDFYGFFDFLWLFPIKKLVLFSLGLVFFAKAFKADIAFGKIMLVVGVMLGIGLLLQLRNFDKIGCWRYGHCWGRDIHSSMHGSWQRSVHEKEYTLPLDITKSLVAQTKNGLIRVHTSAGVTVTNAYALVRIYNYREMGEKVAVVTEKNSLKVDWPEGLDLQVDIELRIPQEVVDLTLQTGNGDIFVHHVSQQVRGTLQTGNGSIQANKLAKESVLQIGNGRIEIGYLEGPSEVTTGNGTIEIGKASGASTLHTGVGDILIQQSDGLVVATTGIGSIVIK